MQTGDFVGEQITGTGYTVIKVRVKNSDVQKGNSGSYRLIYEIESPTSIYVLTIYSKSEQADISVAELTTVLSELDRKSEANPPDL